MPRSTALTQFEDIAAEEQNPAFEQLGFQTQLLADTEARRGEQAAVDQSRDRTRRESEIDSESFERATRGFDLSPRQQRAAGKRLGLSRSIARAERAGSTRRGFLQRAEAVQRGAGSFENALFGERIGTQGSLASNFATRKTRSIRRDAEGRAGTLSTIGSVAGMALMLSSESAKDKLGATGSLLDKLKRVRVERWNYKGENQPHIGPFAEEFNDQFDVGQEHRDHISMIDALGIALGAVKELDRKVSA